MAIIPNPAQGAGRQAFTSMLSIFDLIGTARSLDLRKSQVDMETNVKALKDTQARDVLDVQQDVNKFAKLSPEHFQMAQEQAQTGNFSAFDDAARAAIKRGEITATGYQAWKSDYTKALTEETNFAQAQIKAVRDGNGLQDPRDVAKSVYGLTDQQIAAVKRTDPQGYANVFRKVNWAYNSDKGKEILEGTVLYNLDAQGKPLVDQSGNISYRLGPDGQKMTGKDDFDHAFRQWMGKQGVSLNVAADNPWGTYGKANAASPLQGKGEAEARSAKAKASESEQSDLVAKAYIKQFWNKDATPEMIALYTKNYESNLKLSGGIMGSMKSPLELHVETAMSLSPSPMFGVPIVPSQDQLINLKQGIMPKPSAGISGQQVTPPIPQSNINDPLVPIIAPDGRKGQVRKSQYFDALNRGYKRVEEKAK